MNYLTDQYGRNINPQNPLSVDDVSVSHDRITISSEVLTFKTGAAGLAGVVALDKGPVSDLRGSHVGSYWRDNDPVLEGGERSANGLSYVSAVVETATSATVTIVDPQHTLSSLLPPTGSTGEYIIVLTDGEGDELYGWIKEVAASGSSYTIKVYNSAAITTQSWVGTLSSFEFAQNETRFAIYKNTSSIVWTTGTVLTQEVSYDSSVNDVVQLSEFSNGDYAVDYASGRILYKKKTTGTSDSITYGVRADSVVVSTTSGAGGATAANQASEIALLTTIDADTSSIATDASTAAGLLATIDADTSGIATDTGTIAGDTTSIDGKTPALGTALVAASVPVTIATDDTVATDLTAIKTAVEIMDDWDESNRAAVNIISGQIGVAAGAGAVDALTQRVTLASDDPAVALLATIDADTGNISGNTATIAGDTTSIDAKITACDTTDVRQATHDNLNLNANMQVGDADVSATNGVPTTPETVSNFNSTAYEASNVVKAAAGKVFEIRGYNSGSAQWIQIHDASSLPADTAVPEDIIYVGANNNFSITYPRGKSFGTGIVVCNSSTGPTKTIGAADCWFSGEYE